VEFHDAPFVFPDQPERGTTYWDWTLTPIKSRSGAVEGLVFSLIETTRRKRAEQALREANDDLEKKVEERTAELRQTNELLREENRQRIGTERSLRLEEARLDALSQLSRMDSASLKEISGFALEQAIRLTGSKTGFLGFLNAEESVYTLHAVSKDVVKECKVTGDPLQWHVADAGFWAEAIRERRALFVNDYRQPHRGKKGLPTGHPPVERFMVVPIFEGGRIVALAGVGNKASDYEKSDERQVVLLLTGMWGYVQRNRSREELRQAYSDLEEKVRQRTAELAASAAALQESQRDLNRAQEVGQIGSWRLDVRHNILSWSDEVARIFGGPKRIPLTYEAFLEIVHPDDRQTADSGWKAVLRGETYDVEHRIVVDGRVKWVRQKAYLEFDEAGQRRGSFGITQDITDRKQAEQAVRESEARFRILTTNLSSGVALIDEDGKFALYNPTFLTMFGLTEHSSVRDVNDQSWGEWQVFEQDGTLLHVDDHPVRKAAPTGRAVRNKLVEVRLPSAGDLRWMLISAEPIPQADGRRAIICTYHDVTERKRAEEALRELNATLERKVAQRTEELERRAWQLQKLTLELTEAEERERRRLAEILHDDLQQVLAAAKFQMGLLSSRLRTAAESQEIAGHARDLLTDAIAKSRSLSHELSTPALGQTDLVEAFEWLAEQMQKAHGFTVQLEMEGRLEVPSGPLRILLYKAAREFLFNVVKHAGVREARLRLRRHKGRLRLTVSDRGRGFDPSEAGYTLGFGLLSIRERLGLVGGRLRIRSARGRGSTFAIVVPRQA
jgi:PAS domain S-box-containing protein